MLLDTNILIYFLNGVDESGFRDKVALAIMSGASISIISRIETLGWVGYARNSEALRYAERLLAELREIPLSEAVARRAIELRQANRIKGVQNFV